VNWDNWVRQIHRWFSIAFTVAAIANIVVNIAGLQGAPAIWVGVSALLPLVVLLLTGLYLFALPYAAGSPSVRRVSG
jgi:archaellum biogenesis protein FlaJ (TadC family)